MNTKQAILSNLSQSDFFANAYLADLTDKDLLARACSGGNHIAWQLGHLIQTEQYFASQFAPGNAPVLPGDFKSRHTNDTAGSNDAGKFLTKDEYLRLAKAVRAEVLNALESTSIEDLGKPVPFRAPPFCKTVGDTFLFLANHWTMHAGQWATIRRSIGKPPLF